MTFESEEAVERQEARGEADVSRPVTYEHVPHRLSAEELLASWPRSRTRSGEWFLGTSGIGALTDEALGVPLPPAHEMDES